MFYLYNMKRPEIPPDGANRVTLEVEQGYSAGERLDVLLTNRLPRISRNKVRRLIDEGRVLVDGRPVKASLAMQGGERIEVTFPHPPRSDAEPERIPLDILYEDEHILVLAKPAGMVVHPAAGHRSGTLVNALLGRYQDLPAPRGGKISYRDGELERSGGAEAEERTVRPGIVHRLDKDTSGVMVVARTEEAMTALGRAFHDHDIEREYRAVVWGEPEPEGTVDAPLARHPGDRRRQAVVRGGREAVTHWRILEHFEFAALVALRLETGRTHQIRVHMASRGWPVLGDATYGGGEKALRGLTGDQRSIARHALATVRRQALHAGLLGFRHPGTGQPLRFTADLPEDMENLLDLLRKTNPWGAGHTAPPQENDS
jgi:23S rRNA pseudouridine1911/1915/1917 synthase